jgi:hypothetical protein
VGTPVHPCLQLLWVELHPIWRDRLRLVEQVGVVQRKNFLDLAGNEKTNHLAVLKETKVVLLDHGRHFRLDLLHLGVAVAFRIHRRQACAITDQFLPSRTSNMCRLSSLNPRLGAEDGTIAPVFAASLHPAHQSKEVVVRLVDASA